MQAGEVAAPLEKEQTTLVLSKTLFDSEIQWGRLVIPGRFVKFFRQMQEELNAKGDYSLWVSDAALDTAHQIGIKMCIQRPMVCELHPLYKGHKVGSGDTIAIVRSHSTGALTVSVSKGEQPAATGRRAVYDVAVDASSSFAGAAAQPFSYDSAHKRPRRARRSSPKAQRFDDGEEGEQDSEEEEARDGEVIRYEDDSHLHAYRTGSGRMTVIPARYGSSQASPKGDTQGSGSLGGRHHAAAIDSHQPQGYSSDMEVTDNCEAAEEGEEDDMLRFDALVNVVAHHLSTAACS